MYFIAFVMKQNGSNTSAVFWLQKIGSGLAHPSTTKSASESGLLRSSEGALEVGVGLSGESDEDVRGERGSIEAGPDPVTGLQVLRDRIPAVHGLEHRVSTGLHGHVEVGGDPVRSLRHEGHHKEKNESEWSE